MSSKCGFSYFTTPAKLCFFVFFLFFLSVAELQYLDAVQKIIDEGTLRHNRTGVDTKSIFGMQMRYSLKDSKSIKND